MRDKRKEWPRPSQGETLLIAREGKGSAATAGAKTAQADQAAIESFKAKLDPLQAADPTSPEAYPILTPSWLLLRKDYDDKTADALKKVLRYCLTRGQEVAPTLGYIPLNKKRALRRANPDQSPSRSNSFHRSKHVRAIFPPKPIPNARSLIGGTMKFVCNVLDPFRQTTGIDDHTFMAQSYALGHINNKTFGDPMPEGADTVEDLKTKGFVGVYEIEGNKFRSVA